MNCLNIIVNSPFVREGDVDWVFGPFHDGHEKCGEECEDSIITVEPGTSMSKLLVMLGSFPSISQAKKNWKGPAEIPNGFTDVFVGKLRRRLVIWNPTE